MAEIVECDRCRCSVERIDGSCFIGTDFTVAALFFLDWPFLGMLSEWSVVADLRLLFQMMDVDIRNRRFKLHRIGRESGMEIRTSTLSDGIYD